MPGPEYSLAFSMRNKDGVKQLSNVRPVKPQNPEIRKIIQAALSSRRGFAAQDFRK
jgi:hypothetical protein